MRSCRGLLGYGHVVLFGVEQRYSAAQMNDQVQIDLALLVKELDVSGGHFQRQRTCN